jgi:hypothetical protein
MAAMSRRRSISDQETRANGLKSMAKAMSEHFGVPITEFRYATYEFYNGTQWTLTYAWERRVDGVWQHESWLPPSHGSTAWEK